MNQLFSSKQASATAMICLGFITGCDTLNRNNPEQHSEPEPVVVAPPKLPSAEPIIRANAADIRYAQQTLNALGYVAGSVDGIWGPQSSRAIQNFERKFGLQSANGKLSKLNIFMLEKVSAKARKTTSSQPTTKRTTKGIAAKLAADTPLSVAPQLIILDQAYTMLAKPNPFSERLSELSVGTGIYVISLQEGWYEVESEDKQRGYIQAD